MKAIVWMRVLCVGACAGVVFAAYMIVRSGVHDHVWLAITLSVVLAVLSGAVAAGILLLGVVPITVKVCASEREERCCLACGYPAAVAGEEWKRCPECGGQSWHGRRQRMSARIDRVGVACVLGILLGLAAAEPAVRARDLLQRLEAEALAAEQARQQEALLRERERQREVFREEIRARIREAVVTVFEEAGAPGPPAESPTIDGVEPPSPHP